MNAFMSSYRTYLIKYFQGGGPYEGGRSVVQRLEANVDGRGDCGAKNERTKERATFRHDD